MQNTEDDAHFATIHPLMSTYRRRLHALLTPREHQLFARLDTPQKIQNFLDRLPVNFSLEGDTAMSPRRVLNARIAHCAEGWRSGEHYAFAVFDAGSAGFCGSVGLNQRNRAHNFMNLGYWIRENSWSGPAYRRTVRDDLLLAYGVTLVFALSLTVVAAGCNAAVVQGNGMAGEVAGRLEATLGPAGRWTFIIGFWCAVSSAMLGVWQGIPYLFADFAMRHVGKAEGAATDLKKTSVYRGYLLFLAGPPLALLFAEKPVAIVVLFTVIGGFFMPFLAAVLLYLNNRRDWVGSLHNGAVQNIILVISLLLFAWVGATEILSMCGG